ncbi:MAG: hypothetical protein GF317_04305 [Candidatus Lokiarchaeota archaeon]|nr:hypothetical protein [Candidatus Lokiarchaeota archaeon]MBD3199111.1 hypothetical protein [Candidatus Lokiarchaeota archaeon]
MTSIIKQKSPIQTFSSYMFAALFSVFFTGILLILFIFLFGLSVLEQTGSSNIYIGIFQIFIIIILFLGILLIILGIFYSIGIISRINKMIDLTLDGKLIDVGSELYRTTTQPSSSVSREIRMIRPKMTSGKSKKVEKPKVREQSQKTPRQQIKPPEQSMQQKTESKESIEEAQEEGEGEDEELDISLEDALDKIVERYNDPKVSKSFSNWKNTLMMTFPDLEKSYLFRINEDQGITLEEGYEEDAEVQVKVDSDVYIKMMTKQINPIKAYSSGKLEVAGKMRTLLKLRKLMF